MLIKNILEPEINISIKTHHSSSLFELNFMSERVLLV